LEEIAYCVSLEPFFYKQDFSGGTLGGWASYPFWQDTAYDPNFRVGAIVPDNPNVSIVQRVTPYTHVDAYAGAQKRFDIYLRENSLITFKCYIKSHLPAEFVKVRFAAGKDGCFDCTFSNPPLNRWFERTVAWRDICDENPLAALKTLLKIHAVAFLAKIPGADPAMPFYFGLDDIVVSAMQMVEFRFEEPAVEKLSEWKPFIPLKRCHRGDRFVLRGRWPVEADRVSLEITEFADRTVSILSSELYTTGDSAWSLDPFELTWKEGMYSCTLSAGSDRGIIAKTEFTLHISPPEADREHPRLWFDSKGRERIALRLKENTYRHILDHISLDAAEQRNKITPETLVFDLDQFPDEDWLPSWEAWGSRLYSTAEPLYVNALCYAFTGDKKAGEYVRGILVRVAQFDNWTHPWQTKRGRFTEHRSGWWAHRLAIAYDLIYDLLSDEDKRIIRKAFIENIIIPTHRMYVVDNDVIGNTSNWISHTCGVSLMLQAVMFGEEEGHLEMELYFTGALLKLRAFLENVADRDGAWGEGLGYNNYSFHTLCQSLPALENVFSIDLSGLVKNTCKEYIWAGPVHNREYFYFGDTEGHLNPITNWAWLIPKYRDPLLMWLYNFLKESALESNTKASMTGYMNLINKKNETFLDVLYETRNMRSESPFHENPVKLFRQVGTTVFKSGWDPDDFIFVMRTGPFYNHQHLDQGTFWLADRGQVFIRERTGSSYYDDPLYQSWYTQPVAHSTILIDGNHQSQRAGDHKDFAEGFHDHAQVTHFLDGKYSSFMSGDIGRLYWGKARHIDRNVLYIKPRTVIMVDRIIPGDKDVDVTLLYQTLRFRDITAGCKESKITRNGIVLHFGHISPDGMKAGAIETPHYLYTLREKRPLEREGMLAVTARTAGKPLVMANILRTSKEGVDTGIEIVSNDFFGTGSINDVSFAINYTIGEIYKSDGIETDALAWVRRGDTVFAALCTTLKLNGNGIVRSDVPITCEISSGGIRYYIEVPADVSFYSESSPLSVTINGKKTESFFYDEKRKAIEVKLPIGEGIITWDKRN
jgi:hypothetical protein